MEKKSTDYKYHGKQSFFPNTILVFSSEVPWKFPPYWREWLARELAGQYERVYWVDLVQKPPVCGRGLKSFFANAFREKLIILPTHYCCYLAFLAVLLVERFIRGKRIVYYSNQLGVFPVERFIPRTHLVIEMVDLFYENQLVTFGQQLRKAQLVLSPSQTLAAHLKQYIQDVVIVPTGYLPKIHEVRQKHKNKSVVFAGGISRRIDFELLSQVIDLLPDYRFYFLGEVYLGRYYIGDDDLEYLKKWRKLLRKKWVRYEGALEGRTLIERLSTMSVGIIPYDLVQSHNFMNIHCNPIKLYEYWMAELPVAAVPIAEVVDLERRGLPVQTAKTAEELAAIIRSYADFSFPRKTMRAFLLKQTVSAKASTVAQIFKEHLLK